MDAKLYLSHAVLLVDDIEAVQSFMTKTIGWTRLPAKMIDDDAPLASGGDAPVYIDSNGLVLKLVAQDVTVPKWVTPKPSGGGIIMELVFEADNFLKFLEGMKAEGRALIDADGAEARASSLAYIPPDVARGARIRCRARSQTWEAARNAAPKADKVLELAPPTMSHIAVVVADLEESAALYTDVIGLRRSQTTLSVDAALNPEIGSLETVFIDGNGAFLELVQPMGPGPLKDTLDAYGNGHFAELCVLVSDVSAYCEHMRARGIEMVKINGETFGEGKTGYMLQPYCINTAYFPGDLSGGLRVEIVQNAETSNGSLVQ